MTKKQIENDFNDQLRALVMATIRACNNAGLAKSNTIALVIGPLLREVSVASAAGGMAEAEFIELCRDQYRQCRSVGDMLKRKHN